MCCIRAGKHGDPFRLDKALRDLSHLILCENVVLYDIAAPAAQTQIALLVSPR
jgi:hypothetical protein